MRLSRFINERTEEIVKEWESFARTQLPAAEGMSDLALRDHVEQILAAIARDIDAAQTLEQQYQKSRGLAPVFQGEETPAAAHGTLRHASGFTLLQLTAEYRALRATVLRLWLREAGPATDETTNDIVRFNEAIDQALAESVITYSGHVVRARDLFMGILGHDLRAPLATMAMAGEILTRPDVTDAHRLEAGTRVKRSTALMSAMINDLLGYAQSHLGSGMPIRRQPGDLRAICETAIEDASAMHQACHFELHAEGDLAGSLDSIRLHQLFTNLLLNAAQYREQKSRVVMSAQGDSDTLMVRVKNKGPAIPEESLQTIFSPLSQLSNASSVRPRNSLGLGLFVAREIASAHGGSITVKSNDVDGTEFTVYLPRSAG